jgi:hypothetical protein
VIIDAKGRAGAWGPRLFLTVTTSTPLRALGILATREHGAGGGGDGDMSPGRDGASALGVLGEMENGQTAT